MPPAIITLLNKSLFTGFEFCFHLMLASARASGQSLIQALSDGGDTTWAKANTGPGRRAMIGDGVGREAEVG